MRRTSGKNERQGWVKAPSVIGSEIRAVWQEDEMPQEITGSPGYVPFTLGSDSQAWVDSMAEVVDGGDAVFGRPRPAVPPVRRQLATPTPPPPAPAAHPALRQGGGGPPPPLHVPPRRDRPSMPDIGDGAAAARARPRTLPKRVLM